VAGIRPSPVVPLDIALPLVTVGSMAKGTPIDPGLLRRAAAGIRYAVTGKQPDWFGPGTPLPPVAPEEVKGRAYDFPFAANVSYLPRGEQGENAITFPMLRALCDPGQGGLDLLRLAMETRKDQMEAQRWDVTGRDGKDGGTKAEEIKKALAFPDKVHTFRAWMRLLIEDLLCIDAPSLYFRPAGGGVFLPEVVDGATIKRLVDAGGRMPLPPDPAFQQVIKGVPAVDYTADEMFQSPRNPRPNRIYGMSPVEQVITTVNLALRRQLWQLNYYTDGKVPDGLVGVPESWNPDQIKQFQELWDIVMSGDQERLRSLKFIPGGMTPIFPKLADQKSDFDDWLARVICWAFSLSPQALVKEMNRATAGTSKQAAQEEGLEPMKLWFKDVMDAVLVRAFNAPDLEFTWRDEEIADPLVKAQVFQILVGKPFVTVSEARDAFGYPAATPAQKDELKPPPPPALMPGAKPGEDGGPPKPGEPPKPEAKPNVPPDETSAKLAKARRALRGGIDRDRPLVRGAVSHLQALTSSFLSGIGSGVASRLKGTQKAAGGGGHDESDEAFERATDWGDKPWQDWSDDVRPSLQDVSRDSAGQALAQVTEANISAALKQAHARAAEWADERGAELVTEVEETTREAIREAIVKGINEGKTMDEVADSLVESLAFSESRAETIARTETAFADVQGSVIGWQESGVVAEKEWSVSQDEVCPDCMEMNGKRVPIDDDFEEGDPPLHPNCRCDVLPVVKSDEEIDGDA